MLTQLTVTNFTVAKSLELFFHRGFSAITGETGAGKSITMEALGLCLGDRADPSKIRKDASQATISATFDITLLPAAQESIREMGFAPEDDEAHICTVRRVLNDNGRSKAFINGHAASLQELQQLGLNLATICGQHAQYALLDGMHQRALLDEYAQNQSLRQQMKLSYAEHLQLSQRLQDLLGKRQQRRDRLDLLGYQVEELDAFGPTGQEYEQLEQELRQLTHCTTLMQDSQNCLQCFSDADEGSVLDGFRRGLKILDGLSSVDPTLSPIAEQMHSAMMEAEAGIGALRRYSDRLELDPERLQEVELRYASYIRLAKKHQVRPEDLHQCHEQLSEELLSLRSGDESIDELSVQVESLALKMREHADALHQSRSDAAKQLSASVTQQMPLLSMEHGRCEFEVKQNSEGAIGPEGADTVRLLVQTNPGEPMGPLGSVASGGELSRISLIIQLDIAMKQTVPTLIFDEVDSGISGPTAAVVGKMLRALGKTTQVVSITHLPQVACYGHHHYYVNKSTERDRTVTSMVHLDTNAREKELARLLGGMETNAEALNNARALLAHGEA